MIGKIFLERYKVVVNLQIKECFIGISTKLLTLMIGQVYLLEIGLRHIRKTMKSRWFVVQELDFYIKSHGDLSEMQFKRLKIYIYI